MLLRRPVQKLGKVQIYTPDGRPADPVATQTAVQLLEHHQAPQDAELIAARKSRVYRKPAAGGERLYVKHYCSRRSKERIKRLIRSPYRNVALWRRLSSLGIPSPRPLLVAWKRREAVLVTEEMATPSLRQSIWSGDPVTPELMEVLGRTWGCLHSHRLIHYDPSPGNIVLPEADGPRAGLIDLDSLYLVPAVPALLARHRLQRFFYKLTTECLRSQEVAPTGEAFDAFWRGYAEVTGVAPEAHARSVIKRMEARIGPRRKQRQGEIFLAAAQSWRSALDSAECADR